MGYPKNRRRKPVFLCAHFLHSFVSWAAATFGNRPADIVKRTFPLTSFTVQTIRGIGRLYLAVDDFIDTSRAKRNAGSTILRRTLLRTGVAIYNPQMARLVFAMLSGGHCSESVFVKVLAALELIMSGSHRLIIFFNLKLRQQSAEYRQRHPK